MSTSRTTAQKRVAAKKKKTFVPAPERVSSRCLVYDPRDGSFTRDDGSDATALALAELSIREVARRPVRVSPELGMGYGADQSATEPVKAAGTYRSAIDHPAHYTQGGVECIDAIKAQLGYWGFVAFLRGQIAKYNWRLLAKGDASENLAKLTWYGSRLATELAGRAADELAEEL